MTHDFSQHSAGDPVVVVRDGDGAGWATIDKVTPTGLLRVGFDLFYPDGRCRRTGYHPPHLEPLTDEWKAKIRRKRKLRYLARYCETLRTHGHKLDDKKLDLALAQLDALCDGEWEIPGGR